MTKATISQAVGALEKKSYLTRNVDSHDSRSSILHLTPQGEQVAQKVSLFANDLRQHVLDISSQNQKTVLVTLLAIINSPSTKWTYFTAKNVFFVPVLCPTSGGSRTSLLPTYG